MSRVLFSVWFSIQHIIQNCPSYYSATGSGFSIFPVSTSLKNLGSPEDVPARPVWAQWRSSCREIPGVQNRPEVTTPKMIKFAFYSKMNQVQNCSELTTHTKIDFKRSSAPGLNIAQVAWSPPGLYGLNSAKAAEKFPESKIGPEIGLKTQRTRSQHRSRSREAPGVSPAWPVRDQWR